MRTTYPRNVVSRNRYSTHPIAFGILLAMYHRMRRGVKAATLVRYTMALGLIVSFWFVRSANVDLRARWTRQIVETSRPAVLNGLEVRLDRHLEPAVRTTGGRGRYLVLISSDQCPYSLAEVDRWRELLARVPFGPDDTRSTSGSRVSGGRRNVDSGCGGRPAVAERTRGTPKSDPGSNATRADVPVHGMESRSHGAHDVAGDHRGCLHGERDSIAPAAGRVPELRVSRHTRQ